MHPAKSVIFFTTASGAGYGLIIWLCFLGMFGVLPAEQPFGLVAFGIAFVLIIGGLLSSTFHLGHPERAWRAMSQWRSSWLSREGVAAVISFVPMGLYALLWVFGAINTGAISVILALASIAISIVTIYCTSMIYASLKTIPAWHNNWTPAVYLAVALSTGGILTTVLVTLWGYAGASTLALGVAFFILIGMIIKINYWRSIDTAKPVSTAESATGLGQFGKVSLVEGPHSQSNYLLEEMGFRVARKHAEKLRRIALVAGYAVPSICLIIAGVYGEQLLLLAFIAAVAGAIGVLAERWLFFAEAKHTVMLYYGEDKV